MNELLESPGTERKEEVVRLLERVIGNNNLSIGGGIVIDDALIGVSGSQKVA